MSSAVTALGLESAKVSDHVNFTARFVRAKFESVALANAFLQSQVYGPAGKDGVRYGFRQCFYGQTAAAAIGPLLLKNFGKGKKAAYLTPDYT